MVIAEIRGGSKRRPMLLVTTSTALARADPKIATGLAPFGNGK
jgi:hypothetical protein